MHSLENVVTLNKNFGEMKLLPYPHIHRSPILHSIEIYIKPRHARRIFREEELTPFKIIDHSIQRVKSFEFCYVGQIMLIYNLNSP